MKKISLLLFLIVVCFLAALCLASCGGSTPVKLTLSRLPDKRTVVQGCDPDLTGGLVLVEYKNGDEEEISMTELTVRGFDSSVLGAQSAVLVYTVKDVSASLVVDLTVVAAKVKRLEVTEQNPRSNYFVGESFDKETLTVTAHYETGASEVVRAYTVTPSALSLDTTEITISFREGRVKLPVTVIEKKPVSLNVERTETAKTTYFVGEDFLSEGFSATVTYNDGKTQHFETEELEFLRPVSERVYASPQSEADNRVLVVAHTDYGNVSGETVLSVSDILPVELSASGELTFFEGEYFSFGAEGAITVAVVYNNGEGEVLTANEDLFSYADEPLVYGQTGVEIWLGSYGEVKATVKVNVLRPTLKEILVLASPAKRLYSVGDSVDLTGLILSLEMDDGTSRQLPYSAESGITALPTYVTKDTAEIVVSYEGKDTSFSIDLYA